MRLIPLVPGAIGARPVGTLPAAWCFFFFGCHVLAWLGAVFLTAFLLLRRGDGYGMVINGPRWREIVGSQWQLWKSEREKAEEQTSIGGGWRHAMAAAAAKRRSVEAFMLLALLYLFFLAGRRRGGQYVGARTLVSPPEAASSSISMAACWLESGIEVEEVGESWRMERCGSVWAPVLVPSTPGFTPARTLEAWGEGVPGGGTGP